MISEHSGRLVASFKTIRSANRGPSGSAMELHLCVMRDGSYIIQLQDMAMKPLYNNLYSALKESALFATQRGLIRADAKHEPISLVKF